MRILAVILAASLSSQSAELLPRAEFDQLRQAAELQPAHGWDIKIAELFGLGKGVIYGKAITHKEPNRDELRSFVVLQNTGSEDVMLWHWTGTISYLLLTDPTRKLRAAIFIDKGGARLLTNAEAEEEFKGNSRWWFVYAQSMKK